MASALSLIIPYEPSTASAAVALARAVQGRADVFLAGHGDLSFEPGRGVTLVRSAPGKGHALREALARVHSPVTIIQNPRLTSGGDAYTQLVAPIDADQADVVFG